MRAVLWSAAAERDYLEVIAWIADENPFAAERVARAIRKAGNDLGEFATGKPGRVPGTYEKAAAKLPYILAYALRANEGLETIVILRVIHAARDWRSGEWPD